MNKNISSTCFFFLRELKLLVNIELQKYRNNKKIGSGLDAEVELIFKNILLYDDLKKYENELHFLLGASAVTMIIDKNLITKSEIPFLEKGLHSPDHFGYKINIIVSEHGKCNRCWHRNKSVNTNDEYPDLCSRCILNVFGNGEIRDFF